MNPFAIVGTLFVGFCTYRLLRIVLRKEVIVMDRWWMTYHWEPADGRRDQYWFSLIMSALLLIVAILVVAGWTVSGAATWS